MSDKKMAMFDGAENIHDDASINNGNVFGVKGSSVILRDPVTKKVMYKTHNKVVIAGGDVVARKLFDLSKADYEIIPTYNSELAIPDPGPEDPGAEYDTEAKKYDNKTLLFCVGVDGCGTEGSQVYEVEYGSRIAPSDLVPFRYPMSTGDISEELQESYAGRKDNGAYVAYYFKKFSSDPVLIKQHSDGTDIDPTIYEHHDKVSCYVSVTLNITKEELREFFIATSGLDECRFNTISLCTAYPRQVDGKIYYMDIKPLTKLNFPNEYMIDVTKGVEIIYHVYF